MEYKKVIVAFNEFQDSSIFIYLVFVYFMLVKVVKCESVSCDNHTWKDD